VPVEVDTRSFADATVPPVSTVPVVVATPAEEAVKRTVAECKDSTLREGHADVETVCRR
jgi:hypothetical protein